jgi:2-hydroxy-3-keto-5-methylthiopentenyl-1-phosphate phosphatase
VIHALLKREGIHLPVWANHLEEDAQGKLSLSFPNAPSDPRCQSGLCKCKVINQPLFSTNPDIHRVVIGDGMSDRCWSEEADTLFAKSKLVQYCRENKIPFIPFDNFQTIQATLETQLRPFPKPSVEVLNLAPLAKSVSHR